MVDGVLFDKAKTNLIQFPSGDKRTTYSIPSSVTTIGESSIQGSSLTSVSISSNITNIGLQAFDSCIALTSITVDPSNNNYTSVDGILFNKAKTVLIQYPIGNTRTTYTIPNSVTTIGDTAFYNCSALTSVTIPNSVTSIGLKAFARCSALTSVIIPNLVTSIGAQAFARCSALTKVTIGHHVTSIGNSVFYSCTALSSVYFLGNIPTIASSNFTENMNDTAYYIKDATNTDRLTMFSKREVFIPDREVSIPDTPISNICFPAKTPITTNQGIVPIDEINPEIHTIRNKKIVAITKTVTQDKYLVCFEKNSLGNNMPSQRTLMSKNHLVFYYGHMRKAKDFISRFENVKKVKYTGEILYNVLMEDYEKMLVNNLICETLHPENDIAKVYLTLNSLPDEDKQDYIRMVNEHTIQNKVYSKNKRTKQSTLCN